MGLASGIGALLCVAIVALSWAALFSNDWVHPSPETGDSAGLVLVQSNMADGTTTWDSQPSLVYPNANWQVAIGLWAVGSFGAVIAFIVGMVSCCLGMCCICCLSIPLSIVNVIVLFVCFVCFLTSTLLVSSSFGDIKFGASPICEDSSAWHIGMCDLGWGFICAICATVASLLGSVLFSPCLC
eukprot:CFRG1515T1